MSKKNRKFRRLSLKKDLFEAYQYVKESKNYIYFVLIVFLFSLILGFLLRGYLGFMNKFLSQIVSEADNLNFVGLISFIMLNNIKTAFFGLFLGVFFGIFPLLDAFVNGAIVGYVMGLVIEKGSILNLWALFPHGIFELLAVFISLGLGAKLGTSILNKNPVKTLRERTWSSIKVFVLIVIPLLVVAAIIEGALIFLIR